MPKLLKTAFTKAQLARHRRRGLDALDQMTLAQFDLFRWRMLLANLPKDGFAKMRSRCQQEEAATVTKLNGYRRVVWAAMNYDPEDDAEPPTTHWDRGT